MIFAIPGVQMGDGDTVFGILYLGSGAVEPGMAGVLKPTPVKRFWERVARVGGVGLLARIFGGGGAEHFSGETIGGLEDPSLFKIGLSKLDFWSSSDAHALGLQLIAKIPEIGFVDI